MRENFTKASDWYLLHRVVAFYLVKFLLMRLISLLVALISQVSLAQPTKTMSFCFEEWLPYAYTESNGEIVGNSIEAVKMALDKKQIQAQFTQLPHAQCLARVKEDNIDFVLHVDESDGLVLLDYKVADWALTFAVLKEQSTPMKEMLNDPSMKLAIARSYAYPDKVKDILSKSKIVTFKTSYNSETPEQIKRLFSLLTTQRVDALLIDKKWADLMIGRFNLPIHTLKEVMHVEPQYIGFSKRNKFKAQVLSQALAGQ